MDHPVNFPRDVSNEPIPQALPVVGHAAAATTHAHGVWGVDADHDGRSAATNAASRPQSGVAPHQPFRETAAA